MDCTTAIVTFVQIEYLLIIYVLLVGDTHTKIVCNGWGSTGPNGQLGPGQLGPVNWAWSTGPIFLDPVDRAGGLFSPCNLKHRAIDLTLLRTFLHTTASTNIKEVALGVGLHG